MSGVDGEPVQHVGFAAPKPLPQHNNKSGKLVVKHTFLELETSKGRPFRSLSDPCMLEDPECNFDQNIDGINCSSMLADGGVAHSVGAREGIILPGSSKADISINVDDPSRFAGYPSHSANFVDGERSKFESRLDDEQPQPPAAAAEQCQQNYPSQSTSCVAGGNSIWDDTPLPRKAAEHYAELLANDNSRLAAENAFLRQQFMEVAKAAKTAAAVTAIAADIHADRPAMTIFVPSDGFPTSGSPLLTPGIPFPAREDLANITPESVDICAGPNSSRVPLNQAEHGKSSLGFKGGGADIDVGAGATQGGRGFADAPSAPNEAFELPPCKVPAEQRTTVMLRNLPNNYTRDMLIDMIESKGFRGQFDLVYMPADFVSRASLGYAFINLTSPRAAVSLMETFNGFSDWILPSRKVCGVNWSGPHQGLPAHIERYRNSPVMHETVPDAYKPAIFRDGVRVPFPPPTKKLRAPRVKHYHVSSLDGGFQSNPGDGASVARCSEPLASHSFKVKQDLDDLSGDEQWWF